MRRIEANEVDDLRAARLAMLADEPWRERFLRQEEAFTHSDWRSRATQGATSDRFATFVATASSRWAGVIDVVLNADATGEIGGMWVYPVFRGRGIGRALLNVALAWSAEQNCRRVILFVVTSNAPAIRLYESAGFHVAGDPVAVGDLPVLLQRMARDLP